MSDKTEAPTPQRLTKAVKDGDVAKSAHATVAASGLIWWLFLVVESPHFYQLFQTLIRDVVDIDQTRPFAELLAQVMSSLTALLPATLVTLGAGVLAAVLPEFAQTRGALAWKKAAPDLKRLNPVSGLKNIFSSRVLVDTLIALMQFTILLAVFWYAFVKWCAQLIPSYTLQLPMLLADISISGASLLAMMAASQLVPAAVDFGMQYVLWKRRLRMDKEEIKREYRDSEGDPHTKGRRRAMHQELSR
ncbi:EscU/YscU/HrcU family type III secretion system export apparatus switch protein [Paraburkholderia edwinii]|uniref:EscU/YscU/HrcU family type III secretion system export apparatus switch protein n=1 Tax=Paraburkholderia edwinii TaxID=2861782 RepID=A0ABX8UJS1_9BURK|nr:EscU/YscU/HrcU family type III secretion system export apparatus switch protein [Paraburkholderia edwinii]QYD68821.1 EscU/YscU/HrcU family type III secretion system export apparatus switch protein [Paraburkholderia edwinii]